MSVVALFFPCYGSGTRVEAAESNCRSSPLTHIITALVVGMILGAGSAATAYFLTPQVILWTAIAGGGGFLLTTLITYVALRCCYGPELTENDEGENDEIGKGAEIHENKKVYLNQVPYKVNKTIAVNQTNLPSIMKNLNLKFSEEMSEKGIVYYDPSNALSIPLVRLYQAMLMHPKSEPKREILLDLFAAELITLFINKNEYEQNLDIYVSALDPEIVRGLGAKVRAHGLKGIQTLIYEQEPTQEKLALALERYGQIKDRRDVKMVQKRAGIVCQLNNEIGENRFYFGTSLTLSERRSLLHTMAQELSHLSGTEITDEMLMEQCANYKLKSNRGQYPSGIHLQLSEIPVREVINIIAELYKVKIRLYGEIAEQETKSNRTVIEPYDGAFRINLSDIGREEIPILANKTLYIASISEFTSFQFGWFSLNWCLYVFDRG